MLTTHSGRSRLYVHLTSPVSGSRPLTSPPSPVTTVDGFSSPVSFAAVCTITGDCDAPLFARQTSASDGGSATTSGSCSHEDGPVTDVVARASLNAQVSTAATSETTAISAIATKSARVRQDRAGGRSSTGSRSCAGSSRTSSMSVTSEPVDDM